MVTLVVTNPLTHWSTHSWLCNMAGYCVSSRASYLILHKIPGSMEVMCSVAMTSFASSGVNLVRLSKQDVTR